MGKKKEKRKVASADVLSEMKNDSITSEKEMKKSNKKFGLSLLRQANENGSWEGHELGKLALLISETMQLKKEKFINFLIKSRVLSSQMIAGLQDQGFDFGSSSIILGILYEQSENNNQFCKVYTDALDNTLFSVKDHGMILKLVDITQSGQFSREHVVTLMRVSCSHTETLKKCGQLMHSFCMNMVESQALFYVTQVMKFDFVLDLFGLLEDFLLELGELRATVEESVREILKVNRLGEIVDSDADDDGNLRGFVVDDDSPERRKKKSSPSGGNRKRLMDLCSEEDDDEDDDDDEYDDEGDMCDDEALEGELSQESGEEDGTDDEGGAYINQRTWSPSSGSEEEEEEEGVLDNDSYSHPIGGRRGRANSFSSNSSEEACHVRRSSQGSQGKRRRVVDESEDSEEE